MSDLPPRGRVRPARGRDARAFEWTDHYGTQQVAVVSESIAQREWGSAADAIGKRLRRSPSSPWLEVIGVAGDVRLNGVDQNAPDAIYLSSSESFAQYTTRFAYFFVRSEDACWLMESIRRRESKNS